MYACAALRVVQPEGAGASQLWAPKPEGMPGCLVLLGRSKACELGNNWHGGLNNIQFPDRFRVWLGALHNFVTLNQ